MISVAPGNSVRLLGDHLVRQQSNRAGLPGVRESISSSGQGSDLGLWAHCVTSLGKTLVQLSGHSSGFVILAHESPGRWEFELLILGSGHVIHCRKVKAMCSLVRSSSDYTSLF